MELTETYVGLDATPPDLSNIVVTVKNPETGQVFENGDTISELVPLTITWTGVTDTYSGVSFYNWLYGGEGNPTQEGSVDTHGEVNSAIVGALEPLESGKIQFSLRAFDRASSFADYEVIFELNYVNPDQSPPDFSSIVVTEASGLQNGGTITEPITPIFTWSDITDEAGIAQYHYYFNQCGEAFLTFIGDIQVQDGEPSSPTVTLDPIQEGAYGCYELSLVAQDAVGNWSDLIVVFEFNYLSTGQTPPDFSDIVVTENSGIQDGTNIPELTEPFSPSFTYSGVTGESGIAEYRHYFGCGDSLGLVSVVQVHDGQPSEVTVEMPPISPGQYGCYQFGIEAQDTEGNSSGLIIVFEFFHLPPGSPDLSITKVADHRTVAVQTILSYTITVSNNGQFFATGVTVTDELPDEAEFVSATVEVCDYDAGGHQVTCTTRSVRGGESFTVAIVVKPTVAGEMTNSVTVQINEIEVNTDDNTATETTTVSGGKEGSADLDVFKVSDRSSVPVGSDLVYNISVTNHGPDDATGVVVTDIFPEGVDFVPFSVPHCTLAERTLTCEIGDLAAGSGENMTIVLKSTQLGPVDNIATVFGN